MPNLQEILDKNAAWAKQMEEKNPGFFKRLSGQQDPDYLWIGCSDSRVPANQIVDLDPGEVFVHRNVANVVVPTDLNCQSVIQFAVDVLKVEHIIVCGHFGCGGVCAALNNQRVGLVDHWLSHVRRVHVRHSAWVDNAPSQAERENRLCMANVLEQAVNVCESIVVRDAWARGQRLSVHGWIYGLHDGRLRDLGLSVTAGDDLHFKREQVIAQLKTGSTGKLGATPT